ncbi:hypothetical protein [Polaribacter glomeratus]|uniref:Anti-sigma factor n=1 Tax=Polaribacter glomeratus TaxID=102 RepID=A0A2S7WVL6_9FLAO|nr:hypothetical protein [Polaribacter glomeratus]PQJ81644.1 hypothetical protein BTO16_03255 [Polaribacter glomeratus]TXD66431.1 hypothetical protein ESX12_06520 [Polaribacter glomeratus]
METNNRDKNIKEKFANRTFEPSASAWDRLSAQLDEQPQKKKKGWFFYTGAAASVLLLISIGFQVFSDIPKQNGSIKEIIVNNPIDTNTIDKKSIKFINEIPVEKALVKVDEVAEEQLEINGIANKVEQSYPKKKNKIAKVDSQIVIAKADENFLEKKSSEIKKGYLEQDPNSIIKINSNDLLYAVTHTSEEVKTYYAKNNLRREDILKTIKSELKKSNIKVNPETILAEVERTIDDDDFQNNFMKSLKNKISDIATVIASRND